MNKNIISIIAVFVILVFIGYMIFDSVSPEGSDNTSSGLENLIYPDGNWKVSDELKVTDGTLKAVAVSEDGIVFLGGESFISCYDIDLKKKWSIKTPNTITSLSAFGGLVYASTLDLIFVINSEGKTEEEWGPFEDNAIITSVSANSTGVAFADAGNKIIVLLDKEGIVTKLIGQNDGQFVVPSPYFDVALDAGGFIYAANTGHRRLEFRGTDGALISYFGEPGTAPENFCGCCNPAHFVKTKNGYITAEKGINRIKILGESGEFIEFVSSKNKFVASVPLDLASVDGETIYAANPADSKLYIYKRK